MQIAAPLHSELKPALQWIEVASFFQIPSFHIITGRVTLNRARGVAELPARFQLVATGNLCPCGGWPSALTRTPGGDDPKV
jgi:hypothetical protein